MDNAQLKLFFAGVGCYILFRLLSPLIRKLPISKTKGSRDYIFTVLNLIIVLGGIAISLYALKYTAAGDKMNDTQITQLTQWVNGYFSLIWVLAGIGATAIIG
jgi:protein involved in temperature-dependent protein secretion